MRKHRIASLLLGAIITIGSVSVFSGSVAGATTVGDMSGFQLVSNGSVKYSISTALATAEDDLRPILSPDIEMPARR